MDLIYCELFQIGTVYRLFGKNYMMPLGPQAYPIKIFGWPFFMG